MARLYGRRVIVTLNDRRFESRASLGTQQPPALRIAFKVTKGINSDANNATVEISNLGEDSRGSVSVDKPQMIIEAGYEDTPASLFEGEAVSVITTRTNPGFITKAEAKDGFTALRKIMNSSLSGQPSVGDAIRQVASRMGVGAAAALRKAAAGDFDGAFKKFTSGITFSGTTKQEMDRLAKSFNFDWSIQDGELILLAPGETTPEQVVLLAPRTGLIGSPRRDVDDKRPNQVIVKGRAMLQSGIKVGRRLQLESDQISGTLKVIKVTHQGDTTSGDFFTEFEAVEL